MAMERGLGRGLGALLGDAALQSQEGGSLSLPISQVEPGLKQPRKRFDEESLQDLADSIRIHGVIQPLTVRRLASGYYQIIAGERRWRAAKLAGLTEVPAVIIEADDRKVMELGLGLTQEEVAQRVGKSRPAVANALRLLALPDPVHLLLEEGKLSAGHARAILAVPSGELQKKLAQKVVAEELSVRQTEALAKRLAAGEKEPPARKTAAGPDLSLYIKEAEKSLASRQRPEEGQNRAGVLQPGGSERPAGAAGAAARERGFLPVSQETEKQERGRLQHAAEHERPNKRNSVLFYLVILFAAAFVLLLMSFLMQQRANQAALDDLQQTSDSTVQSLENMLQENESLKEQNAELQAQVDALEEQVNSAQTDTGETDALQRQLDALTYLNQIRALYNEGRYADARDVAAAAESALAGNGGMEGVLGEVSAALTDQERENYDPLEAYHSLTEWLN